MTLSDRFLALGIVTDDLTEESMDTVRDRLVALEAFSHRRPRLDELRGIVADVRLEQRVEPETTIDCEACVPVRHWMASGGVGIFHADDCPDAPKRLIRAATHPAGTGRRQVRERPRRSARIYKFRHPDTCVCGDCSGRASMERWP